MSNNCPLTLWADGAAEIGECRAAFGKLALPQRDGRLRVRAKLCPKPLGAGDGVLSASGA